MNKKWLIRGFTVTLMIGLAISASWALDNGPDTLDINAQTKFSNIITGKDKKDLKGFQHKKHQAEYLKGNAEYGNFKYTDDYSCAGCHHTSKPGEQPGACLQCKDVDKKLEKLGGAGKFDKMYHDNCRDACHEAMAKAGKKTGPIKKDCKGCHPKNDNDKD